MPRLLAPCTFRPLLRGALLGALAVSTPGWAADDTAIVVTARRIDEQPANVPLTLTVVPASAIGPGGVDDLHSLAAHVPGLSFEAGWGGLYSAPALRGQNQSTLLALDAVGMFIDGVYQGNRDAVDAEPLDLARIEVVEGPQSALFGHSSFAGLIHFIPAEATEKLFLSGAAELGTERFRGVRGALSGPVSSLLKARLAIFYRSAQGTRKNDARPGQRLGNTERFAVAASLSTRDGTGPFSARLSARYNDDRASQPPSYPLDSGQYNCGGRDPASGVWSYFCGKAPIASKIGLSPDTPDSRMRGGQAALHLAYETRGIELRSDTSFYRADTSEFRDFDGSAEGELYGVCVTGLNCSGVGRINIPVIRLQRVDTVQLHVFSAREFAQELRIRTTGDHRFGWQIGGTVFWSRVRNMMAYGAARGGLAAGERFSSLVLSNPQRVGAPAAINSALTDDPNRSQSIQNDATEIRRTIALFATTDYRLTRKLRLRGEIRLSWERLVLDSRRADFVASFGTSLGARTFSYVTPRIGIDYRPVDGLLAFVSYARGARSGGINPVPNLMPNEQSFRPETNWTAEIGVKYSGPGLIRSARLTAYDIDWRDAQILGLATTPGINALIVRNTRGVHTQGVELGADLAPARWLQINLAYSYTHPRFKRGSEDPGGSAFCGLGVGATTSSFCTIRSSTINPGQLVPDISGNVPARAVGSSWSAGLTVAPPETALSGLLLHVDVSHQSNVYDRQINGLYFGARTLVAARVSYAAGPWIVELWGTNLGNAHYVSFAAGRPPAFYLGLPRPTDLILGEGRRLGVTVRFSR